MKSVRQHISPFIIAFLTVALWLPALPSANAQAVRPEITVSHPAPDLALFAERWLESDRPRIAIHRPDPGDEMDTDEPIAAHVRRNADIQAARVRDAVTAWELFLLGLDLPYTVVRDETLEDGLDRSIDVLVMPAAASAGEASIRHAARFVRSGGGLIASGAPATGTAASELLEELLDARFEPIPTSVAGLYQVLNRLPVLQTGAPPGIRLNVAVFGSFRPMRAIASGLSKALGPLIPYDTGSTNAFDGLTGAVQASPGSGRVIWTAFMPQDVSRAPDQQLVWQRFALGALGHVGGLPVLSVEPWPAAGSAALGIAVLPSPGFDPATLLRNMQHLLDFLETEDLPATFFLPGSEVHPFPDLVRRMDATGDFGVTTRSGYPIHDQTSDVQRARIREGIADLPAGVEASGFLPPGYLFDGATLRAVADEGLDFVLESGGGSYMPDSIAVHELVDFRKANDHEFVRSMPVGGPFGSSERDTQDDYEVVQRAGGLYVAPFHVEEIAPGSARFDAFAELIHHSRRDGTDILSLSDALKWVDDRNQVTVELRSGSEDENSGDAYSGEDVTAVIINTGDATVSNLVLRWSAGRTAGLPVTARLESGIRVRSDPATGTTLLYLPDLLPGATLEFPLYHR